MSIYILRACRVLPLSMVAIASLAHGAPALETYHIDADRISVSGLSSGGYMAGQMHVAFSTSIMGLGVLAAGPYLCAEGSVLNATSRCLDGAVSYLPPASHFHELTLAEAARGRIDPIAGIAGDRIWMFWGGADDVVLARVVDRLNAYYELVADPADIAYLRGQIADAQHAMITDDHGNACGFEGGSYINDCDYDAAGALLQHIYGELNPAVEAPDTNLRTFDQSEFSGTASLGEEGFIYVPSACEDGNIACGLHIAFHGCAQSKDEVGDEFARHAGYNQWAEANGIIVMYPQTGQDAVNQCWDWWGYTDNGLEPNYATRGGLQMAAVKAMIERATGIQRPAYCDTDSNSAHVAAGRAYTQIGWWFWRYYYASGSDEYLGALGLSATTLRETRPGYYTAESSCP